MFQVLLLQRTPQRAYGVLQPLEPFMPFRDPSMGSSLFDLTVFHCILVSVQRPPALHTAHTPYLHMQISGSPWRAERCSVHKAGVRGHEQQ